MRSTTTLALSLCLAVACTSERPASIAIDGDAVRNHIRKLSSDEMEGRGPASKGEVANTDTWPEWKPVTEFRAISEQMLK